jgi:hypothetical protein
MTEHLSFNFYWRKFLISRGIISMQIFGDGGVDCCCCLTWEFFWRDLAPKSRIFAPNSSVARRLFFDLVGGNVNEWS